MHTEPHVDCLNLNLNHPNEQSAQQPNYYDNACNKNVAGEGVLVVVNFSVAESVAHKRLANGEVADRWARPHVINEFHIVSNVKVKGLYIPNRYTLQGLY